MHQAQEEVDEYGVTASGDDATELGDDNTSINNKSGGWYTHHQHIEQYEITCSSLSPIPHVLTDSRFEHLVLETVMGVACSEINDRMLDLQGDLNIVFRAFQNEDQMVTGAWR